MALVDSAPVRGSRERAAGLVAPAEIGSVRRTAVESAPGASMRPVMTRRYKMSGRVRPLLFWIGKDDIGIARIVWRRGDGAAVGYEFLVGTDPAKAPRSLNRWGYIAEDVEGADGSILALMTGADEARTTRRLPTPVGRRVRAIFARSRPMSSVARRPGRRRASARRPL